ncbi:MAG: SDR family NAD(P)-dependent oxidoreductase [Eubacteriales bacterium]|nr:SDR family NAD(P)-dependent oxidoreductase [Eubacteriales bacterium]
MSDLFRLDGRVAIVTGGGSGLGTGIANALGERGASIVLCDINETLLEKSKAELSQKGIAVETCICDVTDENTFQKVLELSETAFGGADILVNNAGVTRMQDFFEVEKKDFNFIYNINVMGLFRCTQQFADNLRKKNKHGNVVNLASNGAKVTYQDQVHYCSSKAAVVNMTQCMAANLAPYDINVNAVCPGAVDTSMLRACMAATEKQTDGKVTIADCERTWGPPQLGRLIQPVEVGRIIAFLCSDAGAMIRGQSINVDAGNTKF